MQNGISTNAPRSGVRTGFSAAMPNGLSAGMGDGSIGPGYRRITSEHTTNVMPMSHPSQRQRGEGR